MEIITQSLPVPGPWLLLLCSHATISDIFCLNSPIVQVGARKSLVWSGVIVSWTMSVLARTGSNLDIIPRQEVGDETKSCLVTTETEMSASLLRLTQSLLHSSVCTNLLGLIVWGSLDSDNLTSFNVFILPILQLGMSALSEKIQRILRSRLQIETEPSSNSEEKIDENRIKLRWED